MAALPIPAPGSKFGPCLDTCAHRDCNATREAAKGKCTYCQHPIGFGRPFYTDPIAHATCAERAATGAVHERPPCWQFHTPDTGEALRRTLDAIAALPTVNGWPDAETPRTERPLRFAAHLNDFADGGAIDSVVSLAAALRANGWLPFTAYIYREA